ncbi:DNA alkylation repair protein [bacterium]|nr:DNA alkylation repair protein [bacterium]
MAKITKSKSPAKSAHAESTANHFIEKIKTFQSKTELKKYHRFFEFDEKDVKGDHFIGVRMGQVFALAKEYMDMPLNEIEKLLESRIHEVRVGAVSIMDFQARNKKTTPAQLKALFELYIRRHDRIDTWDLVDRSAQYVVGSYVYDKPRDILYKLARSKKMCERRTAIVSTAYFIRKNDVEDAFKISEQLLNDKEDLIHKATGWMLRFAGDKDRKRLLQFLDRYAATMPRTMLRNAIEHFDSKQRDHYLNLRKGDKT